MSEISKNLNFFKSCLENSTKIFNLLVLFHEKIRSIANIEIPKNESHFDKSSHQGLGFLTLI